MSAPEGQSPAATLPNIWSDALTEFTANQIPIHLIDLHTLRLVSRSDVARHYRPILAAHLQQRRKETRSSSHHHHVPHQYNVTRTLLKLVKYAIFSHRWLADGEPTFQDMPVVSTFADVLAQDDEACLPTHSRAALMPTLNFTAFPTYIRHPIDVNASTNQTALSRTLAARVYDAATRAGLHKLLLFCAKARAYNCRFAWSDTCCIHKDSSAELDESIRAMFRWYHNAHICIVHLAASVVLSDIPADEWFTRGWTLQELLAPENIKFYNRDWSAFTEARNDKDRRNDTVSEEEKNPVWRAILAATHIPPGRLSYFSSGAFDIAQRFSWAAGRRTTRTEDIAYALVGIFGIHMPVQYGEGAFSFQRLMEALLQRVREYGIFAWTGPASPYSAALPASIEGYLAAREAEDCISVPNGYGDPSMMLTHKGLQVEVLLVQMQCHEADNNHSERATTSSQDSGRSSDREMCSDVHSDHVDGFVTAPEDTRSSPSGASSDDDALGVHFFVNDEDYQPSSQGRFSCFHLADSDGVFKSLRVRGRGPVVFPDDGFTYPDMPTRQYALAILDYHRDWDRGPACVHVPYSLKSRYLAFILYRDDEGEVWQKMETDTLMYAEVEEGRVYEGQTVSIYL